MAKKEYSKSSINWRMVLINVTAAVALIAILVGVLVFGLRKYTQHGVKL